MEPRPDVLAALGSSYLFEDLTIEQLEPLARVAVVRRLVRGEALWRPGAPANDLYVVVSGVLKDFVIDLDGDEVVHLVHRAGMTIGEPGYFSADRSRIVGLTAVEPSVLLRLHRRELAPFIDAHPVIKDRALEGLASNTRWQTALVSSLATRPLTERLIVRLLELADTDSELVEGNLVTPPISQTTLASMVGVSRENANRALAALTLRGAIRREGGSYVLIDAEGLRREASGNWPTAIRRARRAERNAT